MLQHAGLGKLVLASASPRRREILAAAGLEFDVIPSAVREAQKPAEQAEEFVNRIALEKAMDILTRLPAPYRRPVLAADTVVVVERQMLGKPASPEDAARMLRLLSGKEHRVLTGVCLVMAREEGLAEKTIARDLRLAVTTVRFAPLSETEIAEYVATGEPLDKAGAYGIQGRASQFVESIHGCYFNVVGLPMALVYQMLQKLGAETGRGETTGRGIGL